MTDRRQIAISLALIFAFAGLLFVVSQCSAESVSGTPVSPPQPECLYGTSQVLKPCPRDAAAGVLRYSDTYADYWSDAAGREYLTVVLPKSRR